MLNFEVPYKPQQVDLSRRNYSQNLQEIIDVCLQRDPKFRWSISDVCKLPAFESYYKLRKDEELRFSESQKKCLTPITPMEKKIEFKEQKTISFWKAPFAGRVKKPSNKKENLQPLQKPRKLSDSGKERTFEPFRVFKKEK